jgi:hypothetical protein
MLCKRLIVSKLKCNFETSGYFCANYSFYTTSFRQLALLTTKLSRTEAEMHQVLDENDDLRQRAGLERRDEKVKQTVDKMVRTERESDRALNVILQREIDRLEEERLSMKMQMRKLSTRIGDRAVSMGLGGVNQLSIQFAPSRMIQARRTC